MSPVLLPCFPPLPRLCFAPGTTPGELSERAADTELVKGSQAIGGIEMNRLRANRWILERIAGAILSLSLQCFAADSGGI